MILNIMKVCYASVCKRNLPVYGIKNKTLREFQTTEKDVDKGISRMPLRIARIYEEDVHIDKEDNSGDAQTLVTEASEILDNYSKIMAHRRRAASSRGKQSFNNPVNQNDEVFSD